MPLPTGAVRRIGGAVLGVGLLAGCSTPTPVPTSEPAITEATASATALQTPGALPAVGRTPDAALAAAQMLEETLANAEERLQALELRITGLANQAGPQLDAERRAAVEDLRRIMEQLRLVVAGLSLATEAPPGAQPAQALQLLETLASLADRFPDAVATEVAPIAAELAELRRRIGPLGTPAPTVTPPASPAATP